MIEASSQMIADKRVLFLPVANELASRSPPVVATRCKVVQRKISATAFSRKEKIFASCGLTIQGWIHSPSGPKGST